MGKTTRKMLSILITVVMVMTCMPVNGLLNADSNVYHIYMKDDSSSPTGYIEETEVEIEGAYLWGLFIDGGSYDLTGIDTGFVILNNAEVTGFTDYIFPMLLGNSRAIFDTKEYVSDNNLSYNGEIKYNELFQYVDGIMDEWNKENYDMPSNYTLVITEDTTLDNESVREKNLVVNSGATLNVSGSGCKLDVDKLTLNGTINITAPTGGTDPNGIRIREAVTPGDNADLTAAEGSVLMIDEGASVPGMAPGEYHYQGSDWVPAGDGGDDPVPASGFSMRFALPANLLTKAEVSTDGGETFSDLNIEDYEDPGNEQFISFSTDDDTINNVKFRLTPADTSKGVTAFVMIDPDNTGDIYPLDYDEYGFDGTGTILTINRGTGWGKYYDIFLDTEHFEAQFHFEQDLLSKIEFAYDGSGTYEEMWNDKEEWTGYIGIRFDDGNEYDSITFRFTPATETARINAGIPDFDNWEFDPSDNTLTITNDDDNWDNIYYNIDVWRQYDYYLDIGYPEELFDSVEASLDGTNFDRIPSEVIGFDASDIAESTEITFTLDPKNDDWGLFANYTMTTDRPEEEWVWHDLDITDGTFTLPLSVFTDGSNFCMLRIEAPGFKGVIFDLGWDKLDGADFILGDGSVEHELSEPFLELSEFSESDSVRFVLEPREGETVRNVWVDGAPVEYNQQYGSFKIEKGNDGWPDRIIWIQIEFEGEGPMPGPEPENDYSIDLWYPDDPKNPEFSSITYWIDDGDVESIDIQGKQHEIRFSPEDLEDHDYIYFTPLGIDPARNIGVVYAYYGDSQINVMDWDWIPAEAQDGSFAVPARMFNEQNRRFVVSIYTEDPHYDKHLDIRYFDNEINSLSYRIDDGDTSNVDISGNQHDIGFFNSELENAVNLYLIPAPKEGKVLEVSYGYYVQHGDGRYVDNWINIVMNQDGSFTFPAELLRSGDDYAVDIRDTSGDIPEEGVFSIEKSSNLGGRIDVSPDPVSIQHFDERHEELFYRTAEFGLIRVDITPDHGYRISRILINDEEVAFADDQAFRYAIANKPADNDKITVSAVFAIADSQMIEDAAGHGYAYYYNSYDFDLGDLTEVFASEMYFHFFKEGAYSIAFDDKNDLINALTIPLSVSPADDDTGLPYADYILNYNDVHQHIKVYILPTKHDILIKCGYNDGTSEYIVATPKTTEGKGVDTTVLIRDGLDYAQIFGNGVDSNGTGVSDSDHVFSSHCTQDQSGFDYTVWDEQMTDPTRYTEPFVGEESDKQIGLINTRLLFVENTNENAAVKIVGPEDCPGWSFGRIDTYTAETDRSKATTANIYIANQYVLVENVVYDNAENAKLVTGVAIDDASGLNPDIITVRTITEGDEHSFAVSFNTNYDMIPLALTYSDGEVRYITIHRVAIDISVPFINAEDSNLMLVPHGTWTDDWRWYQIEGEYSSKVHNNAICATYYYPTGSTVPADSDKVTLFVTINWRNGTQETKVVTDPLVSDRGNRSSDNNYRNQYWADYIVWTGTENDIRDIASVEVFAYNEGTGNVFGGVKAGSEHGFIWVNGN